MLQRRRARVQVGVTGKETALSRGQRRSHSVSASRFSAIKLDQTGIQWRQRLNFTVPSCTHFAEPYLLPFTFAIVWLLQTRRQKCRIVAENMIPEEMPSFFPSKIWIKNSNTSKNCVERSRYERHFCSLLPYFLLSWLQIFQLCLSFWASSFDLVLFQKFLQEKEKYPKNRPIRLRSYDLHSFVNRAETWYTASTYPSAKYFVTEFFYFALKVEIWTKNLQQPCFTLPGRIWRSITFFGGRN